MIAALILLGSLSLAAGVVIASGPRHPELTVNICQPLQNSCVTTITLLARPATGVSTRFALYDSGSIVVRTLSRPNGNPSAPDTPPPEPIV